MQAVDRWKRDLDQTLSRAGGTSRDARRDARAVRELFALSFRNLPRDLLDALLEGLEERIASDREREIARCATLGSILLMDYDGEALDGDDWDGLREAFSEAGGEVDLDLLTYVMQLVLDKGRF